MQPSSQFPVVTRRSIAASEPDKCPISANAIESQLLQNGRFTNPDRGFSRQVGKEVVELWKVDSKDVNMSTSFTGELVEALKGIFSDSNIIFL